MSKDMRDEDLISYVQSFAPRKVVKQKSTSSSSTIQEQAFMQAFKDYDPEPMNAHYEGVVSAQSEAQARSKKAYLARKSRKQGGRK